MPNWVTHKLTIKYPTEKMKKALENCMKEGERAEFFQDLRPMPFILNNTVSGCELGVDFTDITTVKQLESAIKKISESDADEERKAKAIKNASLSYSCYCAYGANDWYEWHCRYWGTKWDACNLFINKCSETEYEVEFDTAWSTPDELWEYLMHGCGDMEIEGWFYDEDLGNNCGTISVHEDTCDIDYVNTFSFVLECMNMTIEEFAEEYGYDLDEVKSWI